MTEEVLNRIRVELIEHLWHVATESENFDVMITAWDRYEALHRSRGTVLEIGDETELIKQFQRAAFAVETGTPEGTEGQLDTLLAELSEPGLIFDATGVIHALDPRFVADLDQPDHAAYLEQLVAAAITQTGALSRKEAGQLLRLRGTAEDPELLYLLHPLLHKPVTRYPRYVLRLVTPRWNAITAQLLADAFNLTTAEIDVLRLLYQGKGAPEIAQARDRSVQTVRTQVKRILDKTNTTDQRHVVKLLAATMQMSLSPEFDKPCVEKGPHLARLSPTGGYRTEVIRATSGHNVELCRYGKKGGRPVLLIQNTTIPVPQPGLADAAFHYGLDVIAPFRPGSGRSDARPTSDGPTALVNDYMDCLDHIGAERPIVAGHCSGALYAIHAAAYLGTGCAGLVTIDLGAPIQSLDTVLKMPSTPRRTFLGMRVAPNIMLAPHKMVATDFRKGPEGEKRVVRYFYTDSPHDQHRVETDPLFWRITRDNIAYCFEDVPRLVADVRRWAQDWSFRLADLPNDLPCKTILGAENRMFTSDVLIPWAEAQGWSCDIIPDEGQLLLYGAPHHVMEAIAATGQ